AISIPLGSVSVKFALATAVALAVLSIVKVSVLLAPRETEPGVKTFVNPGLSVATVKVALAESLFPALEVRVPETFMCAPEVAPVTSTLTKHDEKMATAPSLKVIVVPPLGAARVPAHVVAGFAGLAITREAGRVSVKARSLAGVSPLFVISKRSVEVPPGPIVSGRNTLLKDGCAWAAPAAPATTATASIQFTAIDARERDLSAGISLNRPIDRTPDRSTPAMRVLMAHLPPSPGW
ncbi:MAG TPA: hypothetical protein VLB27_02925, partial [candidate division Zixibacteria bacterium]|nr:hypothetical protein [candidate division Zixibacteria bacterium]